jgi:hypothetical protein
MHNPTLIPLLVKDTSINKGMLYRELKKVLPCRIGIEFELAGNFADGFAAEHPEFIGEKLNSTLAKYYRVFEVRCDSSSDVADAIREVRVSIKDFHQLAGLYKFMQDLPKYCRLHQNGGIHIHVDMNEFNFYKMKQRKAVKNYITNRLYQIERIFPKYTGTYNKRMVGDRAKGTWVNMSRLDTLEFRTAPLTFDYYTLMGWIVKLIKFRRILIHDCRLKSTQPKSASQEDLAQLLELVQQQTEQLLQLHNDGSLSIVSNESPIATDEDVALDVTPEEGQSEPRITNLSAWSADTPTTGNYTYYTINNSGSTITASTNGYSTL